MWRDVNVIPARILPTAALVLALTPLVDPRFVVALGAAAMLVLGAALLALVDEIRARGLALDLIGVLAAVAVVVTVVVAARDQPSNGS